MFLLPVLPEIGCPGILSATGVGHVEDVFQPGIVASGINEGDALAAPANIPAHLIVPKVIVRTGSCVRPLGEDQELLVVGVLVEPSCCSQE